MKTNENDLVQKISLLKSIEPKDNWVLFAKNRILEQGASAKEEVGQESLVGQVGRVISYLRYLEKPALVFTALTFVVLGGVGFQVSQNSLPGDALYPVRMAIEKATANLTEDSGLASIETAQRRLEDLKRVVDENRVRNLSTATEEFTRSVADVSRSLKALVEQEPAKALQASRELVQLQKDKAQLEQILGAVLGEVESSELMNATRILALTELKDLTTRTLNEKQETLLEEALRAYADSDFERALELVWQISNQ